MTKGRKTGGRKKGTPNKDNLPIQAKLAAMDCDPITGMATIARQAMDEGDTHLALTAFKELAQYIAPKRKALDVKADVTHNTQDKSIWDLSKKLGVSSD